jgi:hypothetical protein
MSADPRRVWIVAEPYHALTYFAPEAHQAFEDAGLRGFWRGYFAGRAAPLGAAPAGVVTATFYGFHPEFVARAVPSIWELVSPARALDARLDGIGRAARRIFGSEFPATDATAATNDLRRAIEGCSVSGRPMFGANRDLEWPEAPDLALWHALTLLREHRGDGHVSILVGAALDPREAHVLRVADDELPLGSIQPYRGWSERDWADATTALRARGWLDADARITPAGTAARAGIERDTDRLSAELVARVRDLDGVMGTLAGITGRLREAEAIPYPNPVGVPPPE